VPGGGDGSIGDQHHGVERGHGELDGAVGRGGHRGVVAVQRRVGRARGEGGEGERARLGSVVQRHQVLDLLLTVHPGERVHARTISSAACASTCALGPSAGVLLSSCASSLISGYSWASVEKWSPSP